MPRDLKKRRSNLPTDGRIPRPANCFMIFRADWHRNSIANSTPGSHGGKKQKDVSQEAAVAWKDLSPTLKQLYKVQAEIVKEEHSKKYPGWVYQPNAGKRKNMIADAPQGNSLAKRVARSHMIVPPQKPSPDAKGKRKATVTPLTKTPVPMEPVWDGSWFSGSSSMRDPFYSAPLQPIASVSTLRNLRCECRSSRRSVHYDFSTHSTPTSSFFPYPRPDAWFWHGVELPRHTSHVPPSPRPWER